MTIDDSTKAQPANDRERTAMECRRKGEALIKHLNEEFPNNPRVLTLFAKIANPYKDQQLAILEQLVKISPKDANAHGQLGQLYLVKDRQKEGIAELRAALQWTDEAVWMGMYTGDIAGALRGLGCPLTGMDELTSVADSMRPARGMPDEMKKYAADVVKLKKQMLEKIDSAWQTPGTCILTDSEKLTAEQHYEKGVRLLKENDTGSVGASQEGQLSAIREFKHAIELNLDYLHLYDAKLLMSRAYELCAEYNGRDKPASAKQKKNAERCSKENGKLLTFLFTSYPYEARLYEQFERFSSMHPELLPADFNVALTAYAENRAKEAQEQLKKGESWAIANLNSAIALAIAPQKITQYANTIDKSFQEKGCPLARLTELSSELQSMKPPPEAEGALAKEKYASDFKTIKKQILEKIDKHQCAKK
jgi:hypothetical protein